MMRGWGARSLQDLAGVAQQIAAKDAEVVELRSVAKQYHDRVQVLRR